MGERRDGLNKPTREKSVEYQVLESESADKPSALKSLPKSPFVEQREGAQEAERTRRMKAQITEYNRRSSTKITRGVGKIKALLLAILAFSSLPLASHGSELGPTTLTDLFSEQSKGIISSHYFDLPKIEIWSNRNVHVVHLVINRPGVPKTVLRESDETPLGPLFPSKALELRQETGLFPLHPLFSERENEVYEKAPIIEEIITSEKEPDMHTESLKDTAFKVAVAVLMELVQISMWSSGNDSR